jgi:hypothetical protein
VAKGERKAREFQRLQDKELEITNLRGQLYNSPGAVQNPKGGKASADQDESQMALANRYQQKLSIQNSSVQVDGGFGFQTAQGGGRQAAVANTSGPRSPNLETTSSITLSGESNFRAGQGLSSLDLLFPEADPALWTSHFFATPRGESGILVRAVAEEAVSAWLRTLVVLVILALGALVWRLAARANRTPARQRKMATLTLFASVTALLLGVLPVAALILLVVAVVWRLRLRAVPA